MYKYLLRRKVWLRSVAITLLLSISLQLFLPATVWALTAGPTAPEYSSFEPVDTTNMVNLATGDFTYNIPLLEVPGSEGGYPLSLSYHAGISPDEEASWVGLGWTLNPGAINRMVNIYPDDFNSSSESVHDAWPGGVSSTISGGAGWGPFYMGLTYANDTYKGCGVGMDGAVGYPPTAGANVGVGLSFGVGPYGGGYVGLGVYAGTPGAGENASVNLGVMYSEDTKGDGDWSVSGGAGAGYGGKAGNFSFLGVSMTSQGGGRGSFTGLGLSAAGINQKVNDITINASGFFVPIPLPYGFSVSFGMTKTRYYLDQRDITVMNGSLYPMTMSANDLNKNSFDSYSLKDISATSFLDQNADNELGGSLPAFDSYEVLGQGIGGTMQPQYYEYAPTYRKDYNTGTNLHFTKERYTGASSIGFRFVNDFSNKYVYDASSVTSTMDCASNSIVKQGKNNAARNVANIGFDRANGYLAGSKSVRWYTNRQMINSPGNLMKSDSYWGNNIIAAGYGLNMPDQIAGFAITNESGVTYHYALPVYNLEKTSYIGQTTSSYSRTTEDFTPYAYNWLLTGITGPDFVDRDGSNTISDADWGYWVKFEHGLWSDQYQWRNPAIGTHRDIDADTEFFSYGKKQCYYLNAIHTRTHTALFIKDIRNDGKGVSDKNAGGFDPKTDGTGNITGLPVASLRLDRVMLFENKSLERIIQASTNPSRSTYQGLFDLSVSSQTNLNSTIITDASVNAYDPSSKGIQYVNNSNKNFHKADNVLDVYDISASLLKYLQSVAIREIEFDNNYYDLCTGTPNSFPLNYNTGQKTNNNLTGKLTLKGIKTFGRNHFQTIPPTTFEYSSNNPTYNKDKKDMWDSYCADCIDEATATNQSSKKEYYPRYTSTVGAQLVDAWSLTKINSPLGANIKIEYESDEYLTPELSKFKNLMIKGVNILNSNLVELELYNNNNDLYTDFNQGDFISLKFLSAGFMGQKYGCISPMDNNVPEGNFNCTINSINSSKITVSSQELYQYLTTNPVDANSTGGCSGCNNTDRYYGLTLMLSNVLIERKSNAVHYGGGLRTKSITLIADSKEYTTNYSYNNSGVTSYEPFDLMLHFNQINIINPNQTEYVCYWRDVNWANYFKRTKESIVSQYKTALAYANFLPAPGVVYGKVSVSESVKDLNTTKVYTQGNKIDYEFTTFDYDKMNPKGSSISLGDNIRKVTIRDVRNQVGLLKAVKTYNTSGSVISEVGHNYLHLDPSVSSIDAYDTKLAERFNGQGRIDLLCHEKRTYGDKVTEVVTELEKYPVVPTNTYSKNTLTGLKHETINLGYDFFSGAGIKALNVDAYGNTYVSEEVPAYSQYPGMGIWMPSTSTNKNMLTQTAASYTYKVIVSPTTTNPFNYSIFSIVSGDIQTWNNLVPIEGAASNFEITQEQGIWRKQSNYRWVGSDATLLPDGTYTYTATDAFNFISPSNTKWQKLNENTRYDVYTRLLESKDINNRYSAVITSPDKTEVIASASYTSYYELAASGAEYGNVDTHLSTEGTRVNSNAHTGSYSIMVPRGKKAFSATITPTLYKLYKSSVWVYVNGNDDDPANTNNVRLVVKQGGTVLATSGRINGQKAGNWYRMSLVFKPTSSGPIEVYAESNTAQNMSFFDDFRLSSAAGNITTYVTDPDTKRLIYLLDNDNIATKYIYDDAGQLVQTWKEVFDPANGFKRMSETRRNYAQK